MTGDRTDHLDRWWVTFLAVLAIGHHLGTLAAPLGDVGVTQWADWLDLALPWLVVATAGRLLLAPAGPRVRLLGVAGLVLYVQGHAIHLAANSVAQFDDSRTAYLWDELVGHAVWYGGMYVVVVALLLALADVVTQPGLLRLGLALAVGTTWFTNAIGGHSVPLAVVANVALAVLALRRREGVGVDVLVASVTALVLLAGYGISGVLFGTWVEHT